MKILLLVYNRRLMNETRQRAKHLGIENLTVLTYHALGVRTYTSECATDMGLKRVVEDDLLPSEAKELPEFSVLILDEQQDMTPILKRVVDKLIRDKGYAQKNRNRCFGEAQLRLVLLGDRRQAIYGYNNADSRFLSMAACDEVFGYVNNQDWTIAPQTTSYRVTKQMADFLNRQLLRSSPESAIRAVKQTDENGFSFPKPRYIVCDPYKDILKEVIRLLEIPGYSPADILVLAPSVRGLSPTISLARNLARRGIPVCRSDSDISAVDPATSARKVLICSYHQAKGIERKACIVLGCDQGYYDIFAKDVTSFEAVTNAQYVATTRALEHLVLIHHYKHAYLPFIDVEALHETCDVEYRAKLLPKAHEEKDNPYTVTSLCRNMSESLESECLHCLDVLGIAKPALGARPPQTTIVDKYGLREDVSAITGTAVPAIFQQYLQGCRTGPSFLYAKMERALKLGVSGEGDCIASEYYDNLKHILESSVDGQLSPNDILFFFTLQIAERYKDITKLLAIPQEHYNWLTQEYCQAVCHILDGLPGPAKIPLEANFDYPKSRVFHEIEKAAASVEVSKAIKVNGELDVYHSDGKRHHIWEIKHTDSLAPQGYIQLALYMLLFENDADNHNVDDKVSGFLVSARTGQVVQVKPKTPQSLSKILQLLVDAKSGGEQNDTLSNYTDDDFLAECEADFPNLVDRCALPAWLAQRPTQSLSSLRSQ